MSKPELTQEELSNYAAEGKTIILAYRRGYGIHWCNGTSEYILRQEIRTYDKLPYTKRGRYFAMTPDEAHKITHEMTERNLS